MSKERLSRLQKYILSACYKKTVLRQPLLKKIYRFEQGTDGETDEFYKAYKELYYRALYESDILLNYYGLENYSIDEKYGYVGGSNKEKTVLRRSLKVLYDRGYINDYTQWEIQGENVEYYQYWNDKTIIHNTTYRSKAIITLTEKGKEEALKILNIVEVPPLVKAQL